MELRLAKKLLYILNANLRCYLLLKGYSLSTLARNLCYVLIEATNTRLTSVILNYANYGLLANREFVLWYAVCLALLGDKMLLSDMYLILKDISRDVNHLHTVA